MDPYILTFKVILRDRELANVKGSMTDFAILNCPGRCGEEKGRYFEAYDVVIRERGGCSYCGGFSGGMEVWRKARDMAAKTLIHPDTFRLLSKVHRLPPNSHTLYTPPTNRLFSRPKCLSSTPSACPSFVA